MTPAGLGRRILSRWRRRSIGELYLMLTTLGAFAISGALLLAPPSMTSGPALAVIYSLAPRGTWGIAFLLIGILSAGAACWPTERRFIVVMSIQVFAQTLWAVGLTLPSITGADLSNILAPIAWLQLAGTALIVVTSGRRPVLPPPARGRRRTDRER